MILIIDNYDSFVHNLARHVRQLGFETCVIRNDEPVPDTEFAAMIISPGPCTPDEAGISVDLIKQHGAATPILGVCLGHQAIVQAYGGQIIRATEPMHGRASLIEHDGSPMFENIPSPFKVGRYHSLVADPSSLPDCLQVSATTANGTIMAIHHKQHPVIGLQFHPESVLTEHGYQLLKNFLKKVPDTFSGEQR